MRLFVALEIPGDTREALGEMMAQLAPLCRGARWSRPEGMHLTLKFIGEVSSEKAAKIRAQLRAAGHFSPVGIAFRGAGFFPNERHPRVFWAGVEAGPALASLAAAIEQRLEILGIARETREFRPHLTLARFKSEEGLPALLAGLARLEKASTAGGGPGMEFGRGTFEEFHLIESKLHPQGATYTTLETFRFAGSQRERSISDEASA